MGIDVRHAQRNFVHIGFSKDDRLLLLQFLHNQRILLGDVIREEFGASSCPDAGGFEYILQGKRDTG